MDIETYKQKQVSSKISCSVSSTSESVQPNNMHTRRRIFENFLLIWFNSDIDQSNNEYREIMVQLRSIINTVEVFTDPDECLGFLTEIKNKMIFMVISDACHERILSLIHDLPQVGAIYIVDDTKCIHEQFVKKWLKIKSIRTKITSLSRAVQQTSEQYDEDSISVSFAPLAVNIDNQNLDQLEPSFMYTQILKEILVEIQYGEQSIKELTALWRSVYSDNDRQLSLADEFERDYTSETSIWWYTRTYFIYSVLNRALRNLEVDTIIKMAFFIRDLQKQIEQLHSQQFGNHDIQPFTVYRGQDLSMSDLEKLMNSKGALRSFNNFLSTSKEKEVSLLFAESGLMKTDNVGILFKLTIDPSISSTSFALIDKVSYFKTEHEVLFSMHTIFRIGEIEQLHHNDDSKKLFQVELKLTSDSDKELCILTKYIQQETKGSNGWERLGDFLITITKYNMAEKLHNTLLDGTVDVCKKVKIYNQLGHIKDGQGDYREALSYYERAITMLENFLFPDDLELASSYNKIALVYMKMAEYSTALSFHEKALELFEKSLPSRHPKLSISYHDIGRVYEKTGDYAKAILMYQKAFDNQQNTLPSNHPLLATLYSNIGLVYSQMGEYSKALHFYEKATAIQLKCLPPDHPDLAISYNRTGSVYANIGQHLKALVYHEKALEIIQRSLPSHHPHLATSYNKIATVYTNMGDYSKALSYAERTDEILQIRLSENHPRLRSCRKTLENLKKKLCME